ncbi:ATP synthase subunit I [Amphibacillus xylanus]|uniref:Putative F-type Na(+)-transporting ATPase subunit I n=1 Tax=Amphibacillus xylanus (strain ATCC 51415 / DSM 6626 / JCM 7361 / LMG 17667 / NBRC 15112 / Ep01) TaxID=698758 RepID=K0J4U3_AMPXN|nr:ATP synthase subunit I [Amphibacillus xylanus]BAM47816.1 putative F-type Na(+)-transporting ATPase subunit I [Amphibacillus xylanus NBRC 15112]
MKLSSLAKKMIITIIIISIISTLGSVIYHRSLDFLPFLFGAALGSAVSIAKVFLLESAVNKALKMEKKTAGNYVTIQHVLRLLLSGVVLFLGAVVPQISLWGVAVGIISFQIAVYTIRSTTKN